MQLTPSNGNVWPIPRSNGTIYPLNLARLNANTNLISEPSMVILLTVPLLTPGRWLIDLEVGPINGNKTPASIRIHVLVLPFDLADAIE